MGTRASPNEISRITVVYNRKRRNELMKITMEIKTNKHKSFGSVEYTDKQLKDLPEEVFDRDLYDVFKDVRDKFKESKENGGMN